MRRLLPKLAVYAIAALLSGIAGDRPRAQGALDLRTQAPATASQAAQGRSTAAPPPAELTLPNARDSVKFAAIGDMGTGETPQYEVGKQMAAWHAKFPYDFVIMLGDNLYGRQEPRDFVTKFELPYKPLLDAGVKFYA